jgi:hypothetical protein
VAIEWAPLVSARGWPIAFPDGSWRPQQEEVAMPGAAVIVPDDFGGANLESFTIEGHWFGDNSLDSVRVAKEVAAEWWGVGPADWEPVPAGVDDYAAYVIAAARERLGGNAE